MLLSCAASIDGYIDDVAPSRLLLSNEADLDRVDSERADCDAILVGANTIRRDNPRLLVHSRARREARVARGKPPSPVKVTITARGGLDPAARFFTVGDVTKLVYAATPALGQIRGRLGAAAEVIDVGDPICLERILADLRARGVARLMVEGGGSTHTQFLTAGLADELQLAVAPFFVGDSRAPRFAGDGSYPWNSRHRARLADVVRVGDVAVLRYALSERFPGT